MDSTWQDFLETLDDHDRAVATAVMQHVAARLAEVDRRSFGNSRRVTDAHLRIDAVIERLNRIEDARAIDEMQQAMAAMAADLERMKARQVGGDGDG